jgi:hypothetical protein
MLFWYAGLPVLLAFGSAANASLAYYPLVFIVSLFFLILPTGLAILTTLFITNIQPANRLREIVSGILAFLIIAIWAGLQFTKTSMFEARTDGIASAQITHLLLLSKSTALQWFPTSWAANSLSAFVFKQYPISVTLLANFIVFTFFLGSFAVILMEINFNRGRIGTDFILSKSPQKDAAAIKGGQPFVLAMVQKDFKLLFRDLRHLSQLFLFFAMMIVLPIAKTGIYNPNEIPGAYIPYLYIFKYLNYK